MKTYPLKHTFWTYCIGGAFLALSSSPSLADCRFTFSGRPVTVTVSVPRTLNVPKNLPDGAELYRSSAKNTDSYFFQCEEGDSFGYSNNAGTTSSSSPSPIGTTGLGWRWVHNGELLEPYTLGSSKRSGVLGSVGIRIYKIGNVAPGTIGTGIIGTMRGGTLDLVSMRLSTTISVTEASCETPSVTVSLGKQRSSQFGAVGTTIGQKAFSIELKNCPAGLGGLSYRLDPATPAINASQGILALFEGGAKGVGIQITDDKNQVVSLGETHRFLSTKPLGDYAIPLKAAYYKTATTVQGGQANAAIQFTITYQ
ncbi:hypothetical protein C4J96_3351 [Pseudomonas orientalis]|uniref:fimbrial protein n=1 Tax=Pseudomonas orientalis TaxID=76758 RepID=UPI000F57015B|nr:fimbrial protein [Pseudomonas orientalis]AZE95461.1 hypothetical protein C4J96_3351 [Pseudomonas orientalis]